MVRLNRDWKLQRRTIHSPEWDDDEVVVIKDYWSDYDKKVLSSAATEYIRDETSGQMRIVATLDKLHATKRKLAVISWTLKDSEDRPLAFTEDNIVHLPTYVAEFIDSEIDKSWQGLLETTESKEDAEERERKEKEDRLTFQRHSASTDGGPGTQANGREDDRPGERSTRRRGSEVAGT